jgi:hypothetical protein
MMRFATLALLLPMAAAAQTAPVPEEIGSWRLLCVQDRMTDRADCQLRHREPVEPARGTGSSLALEVVNREGRLVPAVVARDLGLENAQRGLLALTGTAQLRFPPNRHFDMPCGIEGRSLVCAPASADVPRAAEELAQARTALVRVTGMGTGPASPEPVELRLDRTADALVRLRARAPEGGAAAPAPGLNLMDMLLRLQRLFGQ